MCLQKKKKVQRTDHLSRYAHKGEEWSQWWGECVLKERAHSIIIHNHYSFGVKKWEWVWIPAKTSTIILYLIIPLWYTIHDLYYIVI